MQDEYLLLTGKGYIFREGQSTKLRHELLYNGAGLLGYGLINVYLLLVVAAFYINMEEIIFKKLTRAAQRPTTNPFLTDGYTPDLSLYKQEYGTGSGGQDEAKKEEGAADQPTDVETGENTKADLEESETIMTKEPQSKDKSIQDDNSIVSTLNHLQYREKHGLAGLAISVASTE